MERGEVCQGESARFVRYMCEWKKETRRLDQVYCRERVLTGHKGFVFHQQDRGIRGL